MSRMLDVVGEGNSRARGTSKIPLDLVDVMAGSARVAGY
jgi:hypothetical protein